MCILNIYVYNIYMRILNKIKLIRYNNYNIPADKFV